MSGFAWWAWMILAGVLGLTEMFVPGAYLAWIALGAALTGAADAAFGLSLEAQLAVFTAATALSCAAGFFVYRELYRRQRPEEPLNERHRAMLGAARHGMRGFRQRPRQGAPRRQRLARRRARPRRGRHRGGQRLSRHPARRRGHAAETAAGTRHRRLNDQWQTKAAARERPSCPRTRPALRDIVPLPGLRLGPVKSFPAVSIRGLRPRVALHAIGQPIETGGERVQLVNPA